MNDFAAFFALKMKMVVAGMCFAGILKEGSAGIHGFCLYKASVLGKLLKISVNGGKVNILTLPY